MSIADNIRRYRKEAGKSQADIAQHVGVDRSAVAQWENGFSQPRMGNVRKLAKYFHVPVSALIDDVPSSLPPATQPSTISLRTLGKVHAGPFSEEEHAEGSIEIPASLLAAHPAASAVIVEGDCMNRVVPEGVAVVCDPDLEPSNGQIVIVETEDHEALIRRLYRGSKTLMLVADSYQDFDDIIVDSDTPIRLIGTVVWMQSPLQSTADDVIRSQ